MYLPFTSEGTFCLYFHYHMLGWHIGILDVLVESGDRDNIVWRTVGQKGTEWLYGQVFIQLREGDRVGNDVLVNVYLGYFLSGYRCNELRVIWPIPHEVLSVIARSTIIT